MATYLAKTAFFTCGLHLTPEDMRKNIAKWNLNEVVHLQEHVIFKDPYFANKYNHHTSPQLDNVVENLRTNTSIKVPIIAFLTTASVMNYPGEKRRFLEVSFSFFFFFIKGGCRSPEGHVHLKDSGASSVTRRIQTLSSVFDILVVGYGFITLTICKLINKAFIHGDLHTGSIMVTRDSTYIFDPEFATYGMIIAYSAFRSVI